MTWLRHPTRSVPAPGRRRRWAALVLVAFLLGLHTMLGTPAAAAGPLDDCKEPPPVEVIGDGMVGSLDPPTGKGPADSLYLNYSYAGFVWHTYDTPSRWPCVDPLATITTWVGNRLFDVGKLIVGAVNGLHYELKFGLLDGLDDIVAKGATVLYTGAAAPYLAFALILVAVAIFLHALRGDLANTAKAVSRVLVGLAVMSATYLTPLLYTTLLDGLLVSGVDELEANLYAQAAPDLGGDVIYADILPDLLHRKIVVDNWAIGEFGAADTPYAQQTTRRLVDAQACSWIEVRYGSCPDHVNHKREEFGKIAEEIRDGAASYATFQGTNSARLGAGFFALIEGLCFGLFQLVCKIGILIGQLVLRGTVLVGPVLGLLAFVPGVARTAFRAIAGVIIQAVILSAAATAHTLVMVWILDSDQLGGRMAKLLLMATITVLAWVLIKPLRRLRNMAAGAVGIPAVSHDQWRLERLLRRRYRRHWRRRHRQSTPAGDPHQPVRRPSWTSWTSYRFRRPRPETAPADPVTNARTYAHSQRVHTPDPYRRAELEPAPPDAPQRKLPRTGPPSRPPQPGPPGHPPDASGTRRGVPELSGSPTSGSESGAPGSSGGSRAETGPAPSTELIVPALGGAGVDGDVVVPSDLEQRDHQAPRSESQTDPPVIEPDTTDGRTVYRIYRPSTDRTEPNTPADSAPAGEAPPARPEGSDTSGWRAIPPWTVDPPEPNP
jgi:hypothetical protein